MEPIWSWLFRLTNAQNCFVSLQWRQRWTMYETQILMPNVLNVCEFSLDKYDLYRLHFGVRHRHLIPQNYCLASTECLIPNLLNKLDVCEFFLDEGKTINWKLNWKLSLDETFVNLYGINTVFLSDREWRRLKSEYESYIMALEAERDVRLQQELKQQVNTLFIILIGY